MDVILDRAEIVMVSSHGRSSYGNTAPYLYLTAHPVFYPFPLL